MKYGAGSEWMTAGNGGLNEMTRNGLIHAWSPTMSCLKVKKNMIAVQ